MRHGGAVFLLALGLMTMVGDLAGLDLLRAFGTATTASPAPRVFSAVRGYETFTTPFFLEWRGRDGAEIGDLPTLIEVAAR